MFSEYIYFLYSSSRQDTDHMLMHDVSEVVLLLHVLQLSS